MNPRLPVAVLLWLAPVVSAAQEAPSRGPFEWGEHWLLAQQRLVLTPVSPDPLRAGEWTLRADLDWGNDFGWHQTGPGESPARRDFLVDGEHRTLALAVRHSVSRTVDVGLRVPVEWRGGGILDGVIDWFHGFTRRLGLPDDSRGLFQSDLLRVDLYGDGRRLAWDDRSGTGVGRAEIFGRWSFAPAGPLRAGVVLRTVLPTATGPFAAGGIAAGAQVVAARRVGDSGDLFGGVGLTFGDQRRRGDVEYASARPEGFLAFERRFGRRWGVVAQSNVAGRLVTNVDTYPAVQWYLSLGARLHLDSGWAIEGGFTENISDQQVTTDFGLQIGVVRGFGRR